MRPALKGFKNPPNKASEFYSITEVESWSLVSLTSQILNYCKPNIDVESKKIYSGLRKASRIPRGHDKHAECLGMSEYKAA